MAVRASAEGLVTPTPEVGPPAERSRIELLGLVGLVALVASPIAIGALSLVGDTWLPMSDWASLLHRTAQVGTRDTPLVGPYSWHGFSHPGPMLYWLAAPVYRLTGQDPRALLWTGALVNILCVAGIAAVAWRRGRRPLLVASMLVVALLVHGLEPDRLVDLWNPYVALLPFLLAVFLVLDAALGRRRALLEAVLPASFAAQSHLGFVTLILLVGLWLIAWLVLSRKLLVFEGKSPDSGGFPAKTLLAAAAIAGVLWLPPLLDAVGGVHNPTAVLRSLRGPDATLGFGDGLGAVGRYLQPAGDWIHSGDPPLVLRAEATDSIALVLLVVLLVGCVVVGCRRRLVDVVAAATLSLTLVVGAVPIASQVVENPPSYLMQWLKVIAALSWGTVGWTVWRLASQNRETDQRPGRRGLPVVAVGAVVVAVAWSWGPALDMEPPEGADPELLAEVRANLQDDLDQDAVYRLVFVNDGFSFFAGMTHWMTEDGFNVVTGEGAPGLKWGRDQRWQPGDPYDATVTFAVQTNADDDAYDVCMDDLAVELVADVDQLTPAEHELVETVAAKLMFEPESLTAEVIERAGKLSAKNKQLRVFVGPNPCGP